MKAAIIGMGTVGRSQARMFDTLATYDITDPGPYPIHAINQCDFAVICVGTPPGPDGRADLSDVRAAIHALHPDMPVLIRSTVPPGTTDELAHFRPGPTAIAPEFLYESGNGPWAEAADVPWLLLGGTPDARRFFYPELADVFSGQIHPCPAVTAELAKYVANLHWATRVTFINEMAAICAAAGAGWEQVRAAWLCDKRVSPAHTAMAGFPPGFAGRCWPKDLDALIAWAADAGYEPGFLRAVRDANTRFRATETETTP